MDGDVPPAPEPPIKREPTGPSRVARNAPRREAKTLPPPPPGSVARKALEGKIAELTDPNDPRSNPGTPPPPAPVRPRTSQVPTAGKPRTIRAGDPLDLSTIPEADKTKENRGAVGIKHNKGGPHDNSSSITTNAASGTIGGDTPPPIFDRAAIAAGQRAALATERAGDRGPASMNLDDSLGTGTGPNAAARGTPKPGAFSDKLSRSSDPAPPAHPHTSPPRPAPVVVDDSLQELIFEESSPASPRLTVPVGEFDHGQAIFEADKPPAVRDDATINDSPGSAAERFELERGDPTLGDERGDATTLSPPAPGHAPAGTLRRSAALPRRRGIAGDMRYVATVVFGVRAANRELAAIGARQATRQQSRRHHLVTLGRTAVALPEWIDSDPQRGKDRSNKTADHPALHRAREQLSGVDHERAQHAEHVAAADAELTRVRRDREAKAKQYLIDIAALDTELLALAKNHEPLDKEASGIKKRVADLRDSLRRIDGKIASTEAKLTSAKGDQLDRAGIQAELATLKAERKTIQSDEPVIAGQLDALNPRIAALEAARGEAQRKRAELQTAEQEDQRRVEELLTAIGAKRKVVDRATADAEALRDKILFQLGERLYVDRSDHLIGQLAPIDEIDVELGVADRRMMELREIVSSIDKFKIARGIALIVVILGAIGALTGWLVMLTS